MHGRGVRLLALGVVVLAAAPARPDASAPAASQPPVPWQPFRSESGRFSVLLPGSPRVSETSRRTLVGSVHSTEYVLQRADVELRVEHHDLPAVARFLMGEDSILGRAIEDFLADNDARELSRREARFHDHPAREVTFASSDGAFSGDARLALVAGRLYLAAALTPPDSPFEADTFFASLEIWER